MRPETHHYLFQIDEAVRFLAPYVKEPARTVGVVLGSGLGAFADNLEGAHVLPYDHVPNFPISKVPGHAGRLVIGSVGGRPVLVQQGRVHLYEGWTPWEISLPARVMKRLGLPTVVVTNAAGGLNRAFLPGDLMLISDHLNLTGANPLVGENLDTLGPRFPDCSDAYTRSLRKKAHAVGKRLGLTLREGVYAGLLGPSYETPAEIRMLAAMGADAVGMSTVHEVIALAHGGVKVLGISCITNLAAGISETALNHAEVTETGKRVAAEFIRLLGAIVPEL